MLEENPAYSLLQQAKDVWYISSNCSSRVIALSLDALNADYWLQGDVRPKLV